MDFFSMEGGEAAYRADFWVYGAAVPVLAVLLIAAAASGHWPLWLGWLGGLAFACAGLALWSLAEYVLHRFVLHRVEPFRRWHGEHHRRPAALIGTPTLLSAALFAGLVFAPVWALAGVWPACAFTLGMLAGYLAYVVTHDAAHHSAPPRLAGTAWLRERRRWHALHHQRSRARGDLGRHHAMGCYGVTSSFWDRAFGSTLPHVSGVRP